MSSSLVGGFMRGRSGSDCIWNGQGRGFVHGRTVMLVGLLMMSGFVAGAHDV